jgi:hypothetical protein
LRCTADEVTRVVSRADADQFYDFTLLPSGHAIVCSGYQFLLIDPRTLAMPIAYRQKHGISPFTDTELQYTVLAGGLSVREFKYSDGSGSVATIRPILVTTDPVRKRVLFIDYCGTAIRELTDLPDYYWLPPNHD